MSQLFGRNFRLIFLFTLNPDALSRGEVVPVDVNTSLRLPLTSMPLRIVIFPQHFRYIESKSLEVLPVHRWGYFDFNGWHVSPLKHSVEVMGSRSAKRGGNLQA